MAPALIAAVLAGAVQVTPPACRPPWYDHDAFVRLLAVDVADAASAKTSTRTPSRVALYVVDCDARPNEVRAEVVGARAETVDLGDVPRDVRLRTLSLAIAEILATPPVEADAVVAVPDPAISRVRLGALGAVRVSPKHGQVLFGGGATIAVRPFEGRPFSTTFALAGEGGTVGVANGDVGVRAISAHVGADVLVDAGPVEIGVGPRAELGWIWVAGEGGTAPIAGASGSGAFSVLAIGVCATRALTDDIDFALAVDVGGTLRAFEATADGRPVAGIAGVSTTIAVAIGGDVL